MVTSFACVQVDTPAVVAMVFTGIDVTCWVAPVAITSEKTPAGSPPLVAQPVVVLAVLSRHRSPFATTGVTEDTMDQVERAVVEAHSARFAWPEDWAGVEVVTCAVTVPDVVWPRANPGRSTRRSIALRSMGRDCARPGPPMQAPVAARGRGPAAPHRTFWQSGRRATLPADKLATPA